MAYYNVCWNCRHEINSDTDKQCEICGWYICPQCGACQQGGCVTQFTDKINEWRYLREKYAEMQPDRFNFPIWCKETLAEKREKDKETARIEKEQKDKLAAEQAAREKELWDKISIGTKVNHPKFQNGYITSKYYSGSYQMLTVHFTDLGDSKTFIFSEVIKKNLITIIE